MRLADELLAGIGTESDLCGMVTQLAASVQTAKKFEVGPDVQSACVNVSNSKPSSIASALHLARLPYPRIWVEWRPADDGWTRNRRANDKPRPMRIGFLAEELMEGFHQSYNVTWAWSHKEHGINICPLGAVVNLAMTPELHAKMADFLETHGDKQNPFGVALAEISHLMREEAGMIKRAETIAAFREKARSAWRDLPESEVNKALLLNCNIAVTAVPYAFDLLETFRKNAPEHYSGALRSWCEDIEGEPLFALSFLLMLNSPNALERAPQEDFSKLNRARERRGNDRPLQEFVVTKLRLPKGAAQYVGRGGFGRTAEELGTHDVRGHFKVRKTGVFWWMPFLWGARKISGTHRENIYETN